MSTKGDRGRERMYVCVCVMEKWRTGIFSWADGSFSNLFIAFNGKSSVGKRQDERDREEKEETKPKNGKHTYTQWKTRQTTMNDRRRKLKVECRHENWTLLS